MRASLPVACAMRRHDVVLTNFSSQPSNVFALLLVSKITLAIFICCKENKVLSVLAENVELLMLVSVVRE